jgi:hypothetical protein
MFVVRCSPEQETFQMKAIFQRCVEEGVGCMADKRAGNQRRPYSIGAYSGNERLVMVRVLASGMKQRWAREESLFGPDALKKLGKAAGRARLVPNENRREVCRFLQNLVFRGAFFLPAFPRALLR